MKNSYSISEKISNVYSLITTKIFYKKARFIRRPFYCRGKQSLQISAGFTTGYHCRFDLLSEKGDHSKKLIIGKNSTIGDNVHIVAKEKVIIGDNCLIASKVFISDTNHGDYFNNDINSAPNIPPNERPLYTRPVTIGDNVWIGENVCVLWGVSIGNGSIIGAQSVVNKNIPDNCIAIGNPTKIIKMFDVELKAWVKFTNENITN